MSKTIVIDVGSSLTKGGFAFYQSPNTITPSVVGNHKKTITSSKDQCRINSRPLYHGNDAITRKTLLDIDYPIERSIITDWEEFEYLLEKILLNDLHITMDHNAILVTDTPKNPISQRIKLAELLFECWNFEKVNISTQTILSLYANGRIDGVVLNIGDGTTQIMPIYEGYMVSEGVKRINIAGRDVSAHLNNVLNDKGVVFCEKFDRDILNDIKNEACCADITRWSKEKKTESIDYFLPDGKKFSLSHLERAMSAEILFRPENAASDSMSIPKYLNQAVSSCEIDIRRQLYANIILSGGTTLLDKFPQRLGKELQCLLPFGTKMNIIATPDRHKSSWIGGSILASLSTCNWLYKENYEESGCHIVNNLF